MIYSELKNMNRNLITLNGTMHLAVAAIQDVERMAASISVDTKSIATTNEAIAKNSAVIAHNTAITAFYSKKTAELTDALGYMVAFS